jgi:hypothetical protein
LRGFELKQTLPRNGQQFSVTGAYENSSAKSARKSWSMKKGVKSQPLSADERVKSYEAALLSGKAQASLTVREKSYGKRISVCRRPSGNLPLRPKIRAPV